MNKNENSNFFGASEGIGKDGKKNIKLKDVFIIPNNKKIKNDISITEKELNKKVNSTPKHIIKSCDSVKSFAEKSLSMNNESMAERNLKVKNKKNKFKD
jgi:hypothetical protein